MEATHKANEEIISREQTRTKENVFYGVNSNTNWYIDFLGKQLIMLTKRLLAANKPNKREQKETVI